MLGCPRSSGSRPAPGARQALILNETRSRVEAAFQDFDVARWVVAGPRQSEENPLGIGGMRLHEWVFPLAAWRAMHGLEGGEATESTAMVEESTANIGATVMGRNMRTIATPRVVHVTFARSVRQ